jgi:dipeptidyl aminopeptidase/acylaminoacyl peptidase
VAASPSGALLAIESVDGSRVLNLAVTPAAETKLHPGATGFDWSAKGELAFLIQHDSGSELYVAGDGKQAQKVASSASGQSWSDLNWAPDSASLLLATQAAGSGGTPGLLLINRDGSSPTTFGAPQREYAAPQWSPSGDLVLFTRHDEAGGKAFWTATSSPSGNSAAEQQALAEVETFMQARIRGDAAAAQAELDDSGRAAYQAGASSLLSANGTRFDRYYPVTVQLSSTNPNEFLVGVRVFIARSATETSFFEEQLSLLEQGQRYRIHAVKASAASQLSRGPSLVSFEVVQNPPGQVVRVHFDADMKAETINAGTIQVRDQAGSVASAQVTFDPNGHLASLAVKLRPGSYQLVVTTGVTDINGTALAQEYDATLLISR